MDTNVPPRSLIAGAIPVVLLGGVVVYPLLRLVVAAYDTGGGVTGVSFDLFSILTFTYAQAAVSAFLAAAFGVCAAVIYAEQEFPGRTLLWRLSLVSFSLPPILTVLAYLDFWRGSLLGWPMILMAHVFYNYPLAFKSVGAVLTSIDRTEERAALSLGQSRRRCFWEITLPKLFPAIRGALCLAFLYSAGSFLIVLMLGGGPRFTSVEVAIYQATRLELDLPFAVKLAAIQLAVSGLVFYFARRNHFPLGRDVESPPFPIYAPQSAAARWMAVGLLFVGVFAIVVGPLAQLIYTSFRALLRVPFAEILAPLRVSLLLAGPAAILAVIVGLGAAYYARHGRGRKWIWDGLMNLPLAVSSLVLSLGILLAYRDIVDNSFGAGGLVIAITAVSALPIVYRLMRDRLAQIDDLQYRAATSLGAGPGQRWWRLELPNLRKTIVIGAMFAGAVSLGELGAVLMLARQEILTLPVEMYRLMGQYRFAEAHALGAVLVVITGLSFLVIGRFET